MDTFFAKFRGSTGTEELGELHGVLWESDDNSVQCRACKTPFTTIKRRHHCRGCGGVFCENCLQTNILIPSKDEAVDKACPGCCSGLMPGAELVSKVESAIKKGTPITALGKPYPIGMKYAPGETIPLDPGERFVSSGDDNTRAPSGGYFSFINKTRYSVAIKLLQGGSNYLWETPRPLFEVVAPGESFNTYFSPLLKTLDLVLLTNNSSIPPMAESYSQSTKASSRWARIDQFRDFVIYQADCSAHNVLIKYKGSGLCELRRGTSIGRHGMGVFTGCVPAGQLDFETNCPCIERVFTSLP